MNDGRSNTFLTHLEQVINESNPALILCVIPSARGDIYSLIKRKLCIDRAGMFLIYLGNCNKCVFIIHFCFQYHPK